MRPTPLLIMIGTGLVEDITPEQYKGRFQYRLMTELAQHKLLIKNRGVIAGVAYYNLRARRRKGARAPEVV